VFRNSLATDGEEDWDCALCGFANRPRALNCNLCGTDHDAIVCNYTAVRLSMRVCVCARVFMI